ncbi:uncharacterized protein I206_102102 [Kwoniella pini CBS 10737]|uniref:Uncharacterized protein n=1 Tax=Kwoniella pini CBS 10737 TaxID=1296096 RepID=A0A1B9HUT6_9TREE|nr:uncharacterized protein I206_06805 [Kwoniella pini CBS 10737]OCF47031.1 hypothetical protein I206_06805 [Kwoniella pini CBS 10737]
MFAMPHLNKRLMLRTGFISISIILLILLAPGLTSYDDNSESETADRPSSSPYIDSGEVNGWNWDANQEKRFNSIGNHKTNTKSGWSSRTKTKLKDIINGRKWKDAQAALYGRDGYESVSDAVGKDGWVNLEKDLIVTRYEGGTPGYQVFSNLYLVNSVLTSVVPSKNRLVISDESMENEIQMDMEMQEHLSEETSHSRKFPDVKYIMSSEKRGVGAGEDRWKVVDQDVGREEIGRKGFRLGGVTYIFNDPPGPDGYLVYFRHFVLEAFLGATRVLASTLSGSTVIPTPKRVWFPRSTSEPSWRDDRGENAWFLAHALPAATIEDKNGWDDKSTAGLPILLEKVVIIDRWAAHSSGGEVGKWGKMNALIPSLPAVKTFWEPFRSNVIRSLGVDGHSEIGSRGLPVIVYVDRQKESPKLKQSDHNALVEGLMSLTNIAEVHVARIAAMSKARQVELMGRAQVIVSLHGDELFTSLWMPQRENSLVIELFEEGGFVRDFELLASGLNHKYVAISGDQILIEEKWRETGSTKGPERDNGEISINTELIIRTIEETLNINSIADD